MAEFGDIISGVSSALAKDVSAKIYKSGDINLTSRAPYGILTGIPELDYSLGRPGLPAGKVVEYFGFEMSGKTTAALHAIAQAQRKGGAGIFIDTEMSWDEDRAISCGINPDVNFAPTEADTIEGIFRILEETVKNLIKAKWNKPFIAVVDSITGVQSQRGKDTEIGAEPRVGEDARVIRHGMRKLVSEFGKANMTVIFINHAIATIAASPFAKQSTSSGGHAIKFMSAVRVQFTGGSSTFRGVGENKIRTGQKTYVKVEKLKGSSLEYPQVECPLLNDRGFDAVDSLLLGAVKSGLILEKSNKTFSLNLEDPLEFKKRDWPGVVDSLGGLNSLYDFWISWCLENDKMLPWSQV